MVYWVVPLWIGARAHDIGSRLNVTTACGRFTSVYRRATDDDARCSDCLRKTQPDAPRA
jgi:hypothetical protein